MKFINKIIVVCLCASVFAGGCGQSGQDTTKSKKSESTGSSKKNTEQASSDTEASKDIFAMDTYMTVTAYGEKAQDAVDAAEAEIERLDTLLSTGNADSEIAKLNEQKSAALSEDGGYLVKRALELNKETDGAFDIAIYPVMEAWGFPTQNFRVPSADELTGTSGGASTIRKTPRRPAASRSNRTKYPVGPLGVNAPEFQPERSSCFACALQQNTANIKHIYL